MSAPPVAAADHHPPLRRAHLLMLAGITVLAAVLRLHRLGDWALWIDEAHTYRDVLKPAEEFWASNVSYYPLSYLVLRGLVDAGMPCSEGWLRLPFVFCGILSVAALGLAGRRLVGPRAALLAALLLALSPWHIYWSQNARSYSMVLLLSLLATAVFARGAAAGSPLHLLGVVLLAVGAGMCHPSAYLMLCAYAAYGLWPRRDADGALRPRSRWMPLAAVGLFAAAALLLLPLLEHFRVAKPDLSALHLAQTMVFFVRVPLGVAALGGLLWLLRRRDPAAPLLACWVGVPVLLLAAAGSGLWKVTAQYAFFTLPAFCLLAGAAAVAIHDGARAAGVGGRLLGGVLAVVLLLDMAGYDYLYFTRYFGERPRWREAAEFVASRPGDRKRVLTTNQPSMAYYLDPAELVRSGAGSAIELVPLARYQFEEAVGQRPLSALVEASAAVPGLDLYVVVSQPELDEMDQSGAADRYLRERLHQVERFSNSIGPKDMTVLVYRLAR